MIESIVEPQKYLSVPEICLLFQNDALADFVSLSKILLGKVEQVSGEVIFQCTC